MHPQTQMIDKQNEINDFRFESDCNELENINILVTGDDDILLLEVRELELTMISLDGGRFRLEAILRLYSEIAKLQREIEMREGPL